VELRVYNGWLTPTHKHHGNGVDAGRSWQIDPAPLHVEFAVRHLMISSVKGAFGDVQGGQDLRRGGADAASECDVAEGSPVRELARPTELHRLLRVVRSCPLTGQLPAAISYIYT
jgi:YceI-like protein